MLVGPTKYCDVEQLKSSDEKLKTMLQLDLKSKVGEKPLILTVQELPFAC